MSTSSDHEGSDRVLTPAEEEHASRAASSRRSRSSGGDVQDMALAGSHVNGNASPSDEARSQAGGEDEDLFGDEDAESEEHRSPPTRTLDDVDLDSGDDEGRADRIEEGTVETNGNYGADQKEIKIMDLELSRLPQPEKGDGELYFFHNPAFMSIGSEEFSPESYEPPKFDHHGSQPPQNQTKHSTFTTASTEIHWRHAPNSDTDLQSNARIIRWSDGSLTLQLASNPLDQFAINAKSMADPQINPRRPTPVSISSPSQKRSGPSLEANTYLATPVERAGMYRAIGHFTASLQPVTVSLTEDVDSAISNLRDQLAATRRLSTTGNAAASNVLDEMIDPEEARRQAEALEKEKVKSARRAKTNEERQRNKDMRGRTAGRGPAGLSIRDLEDDEGMPTTTRARPGKRSAAAIKRRRAANRRGEIYSDDDEGYGARGRTREDEYDVDDGFLVGSDEEEEIVEDDEDEEEEMMEPDAEGEDETPPPRPQPVAKPRLMQGSPGSRRVERERPPRVNNSPSPKRTAAEMMAEDVDSGTPSAAAHGTTSRAKRRFVVEDDEDE